MSLINCPECGKQVSNKAPQCIHCGNPLQHNSYNSPSPQQQQPPIIVQQPIQQSRRPGCLKIIGIVILIGIASAIFRSCSGGGGQTNRTIQNPNQQQQRLPSDLQNKQYGNQYGNNNNGIGTTIPSPSNNVNNGVNAPLPLPKLPGNVSGGDFDRLQYAAQNGDVKAMAELGKKYMDAKTGVNIEENKRVKEQARYWLQKAAEQGNADAQANLGFAYQFGIGGEIDKNKAAEWIKKAAENGNAEAQSKLSNMYETGEIMPKDNAQAFYWLQKAAESGDANAQVRLGRKYSYEIDGTNTKLDCTQALHWFEKSANHPENSNNAYMLAWEYTNGICGQGNYDKALRWMETAAEKNNERAQFALGMMYKQGQGVAKNETKANYWLKKASEKRKLQDLERDYRVMSKRTANQKGYQ